MSSFPSSASSSTPPSSAPPHRPTSPRPTYRRHQAVTDAIVSSLAGDHPSVPPRAAGEPVFPSVTPSSSHLGRPTASWSITVIALSLIVHRRRLVVFPVLPSCSQSRHHHLLLGTAARCSQFLSAPFSVRHRQPLPSSSLSPAAAPACLLYCTSDGRACFGPLACHCCTDPSVSPSPVILTSQPEEENRGDNGDDTNKGGVPDAEIAEDHVQANKVEGDLEGETKEGSKEQ
ncbi:hypothetical protein E2562_003126 [Oryza meyeriana var. granulata]|uniref:Uncharacterized protein n=1 Tax=Oryza meyeriana var. granulata TaxID=110450 RepID=A0A6G1E9S2_9ORYZ|nr:hypothetical protein E2562_003126 [Oryza meyeriana var. granulata]